ncbi:Aspartate racemase [hydrothermal vent metagenome]|uniref:Aspartate racemase n=1 Tax=hydrothermal vent metagenome TaxID=652676 RepID=A0A3B0UG75_9ZZZZ
MKTIGLIGGMSWESSAIYYEYINKKVRELKGGFHSCKNIMVSVDFAEIEKLQHKNNWKALNKLMVGAAKQLETAGADIIILCTNTMHLCSSEIVKNISTPFLHIAEATGEEIIHKNIKKVALIGTKFTMEKDFYKGFLTDNFEIEVIIPTAKERQLIHDIIYNELVVGEIKDKSRTIYKTIISNLEKCGAKGVILGCTEIPLLISNADVNIPVFNTTKIHAEKAVEWALKNS